MHGIEVDFDPALTVEVPRDEPPAGWAAAELERLRAHDEALVADREAVVRWLDAVRGGVAPTATYTLAVRSPQVSALAVLRFDVIDEPLPDEAQRTILEPPATLPPRHDVVELAGLGGALRMQVLAERAGEPYALVQWLAVRAGGTVIASLGPLPPQGIEAFRPYAEAIVGSARPVGLELDGVPWLEQPSRLVEVVPQVESWNP
jgi:hypothetical protein